MNSLLSSLRMSTIRFLYSLSSGVLLVQQKYGNLIVMSVQYGFLVQFTFLSNKDKNMSTTTQYVNPVNELHHLTLAQLTWSVLHHLTLTHPTTVYLTKPVTRMKAQAPHSTLTQSALPTT